MSLDRARQDIHSAIRSIVRYPIASTIAVLSLAAGIGAMATTLTIRDVVFHNPPPEYGDVDQLTRVQVGRGTRPIVPIGSYPAGTLFATWTDAFGTSMAAAAPPRGLRDVRTGDRIEAVPVREVTSNLFTVLAVKPVAGTLFAATSADSAPAILSYRLWQQWFDGRADAVGATIWIENRPHTIVGVLPRRFWFAEMHSPVWIRLAPQSAASADALDVIVRRSPGTTTAMLDTQLQPGLAEYAARVPADERPLRLKLSPIEGTPLGAQVSIALPWVLGVAVVLTLLIACANVAILMIAQWTAREHEIAIRASLGASRGRLIRALLTESMVIAIAGGVLGVGTTFLLRTIVLQQSGASDGFFDLSIRPRVLLASMAITMAAGILTGLAPALLETRRLHGNPLRATALSDRIRQRWRHALVVLEISVTVALLVVAAAFVNGYRRALAANMGFPTQPMLTARVENNEGVPVAAVLDAAAGIPGVSVAAASTTAPFMASGPRERVAVDASGANAVAAERGAITPAFFAALDVPIRAGRAFTTRDSSATRTVIVNEALARRLFADGSAIGRRAWVGNVDYDIVGVCGNFSNSPFFREFEPRFFVPMAVPGVARVLSDPPTPPGPTGPGLQLAAPKRADLVIRANGDPAALVQTVRRRLRDAAAGNVVTRAFTYDQIKTISGQEILVGTAPLVPLILIGMLLMAAGIYGVLAFAIARRSRELAVRVAIGASSGHLVRLVASHSLRLVVLGAAFGIALTYALTRVVRASGGAGTPFDADWSAFAFPVVIVVVIGALATWMPSRRVLNIEPAAVLKAL